MALVSTSTVSKEVPVSVCGRLCHMNKLDSLGSLQRELQQCLGIEQDFDVCDNNGRRICTDQQLEDAISGQRLPLQASLSDASVHLIENRREELAQMQWKVMRDKMQSFSLDVAQLTKQISDLQQQLEVQGKEHDRKLEALRGAIGNQLLEDRSNMEATVISLSERVQSFTTLVNGEQNKREHASKALENQLQDLRRVLDQERHERIQEAKLQDDTLKQCRVMCEAQKHALESTEQQRLSDLQSLKVELGRETRDWSNTASQKLDSFKASLEEVSTQLRLQSETSKQAMERSQEAYDFARKINDIEVKCQQLDVRLSQTSTKFSERQQSITERQDQVWELFEGVRADKQSLEVKSDGISQQVQDLSHSISKFEEGSAKLIAKEVQALRDELVASQNNLSADHTKQISDLESRCSERFERESRLRERMLFDKISNNDRNLSASPLSLAMEPTASPATPATPASPSPPQSVQSSPRGAMPAMPARCLVLPPSGTPSVPDVLPAVQTAPPVLWSSFGKLCRSPSTSHTSVTMAAPPVVISSPQGFPATVARSGQYPPLQAMPCPGSPRDVRTPVQYKC